MDFKKGDKVVGFDGEKMFSGVVMYEVFGKVEIGNGITSRRFKKCYVYPTGTTIKVILPLKVVDGWVNIYLSEICNSPRIMNNGLYSSREMALNRRDGDVKYIGPPFYITHTPTPDVVSHDNPFTQSTDAMVWAEAFVEHKKRCRWDLNDIDESLMVGWFANAMTAQEFVGKKSDTVTLNRKSWEKMKENIRAEHSNASNMELAYKWGLILNNIEEVEA